MKSANDKLPSEKVILQPRDLQKLFDALSAQGFRIVAPALRDGAIVYEELANASDLPVGWTDEQEKGRYRLQRRKDKAYFSYAVGPHSWKKFLFPPRVRLWTAQKQNGGFEVKPESEKPPRFAFIGVRACELQAIDIQDKIFMKGDYVDPVYKGRRENVFIVAVNCVEPADTCFCVSMKTGPEVKRNFDLALTEIVGTNQHYFLVETGSSAGKEIINDLPHRPAQEVEKQAAEKAIENAAEKMGRFLETKDLENLLYENMDHPRWDEVASRCLNCANCTMVCPTCFCTTVEDVTDLTGETAERWRTWDSCFTLDFSYIHGGSIRATAKSRYRQWMTHKLASWIDQFGTSGCVGCGRCITWCPVGIDITEEVAAMREKEVSDEFEEH